MIAPFLNPFVPTVAFSQHLLSERLTSLGIRGALNWAPLIPRDVSLSDSKCWNGGQKWVKEDIQFCLNAERYV